jgi:thioredoxin-like negative regulator of GroEL
MKVNAVFVRCTKCKTINKLPAEKLKRSPICGKCKAPLKFSRQKIEATVSSFDQEVLAWPGIVFVEFWSPRCGHCMKIAPIVEALAHERAGLMKMVTVNIDNESPLASRFQIQATPFMMLYMNGDKLSEIAGALPKEQLEAWIDSSLLG